MSVLGLMVPAVWWWGARAEGKRDTPAAARCIEEGGQRTSWHGHVIACQDERTRFREPLFSACLTLTKNEPPQRAASSPRFACPASFYSFFVGQPSRRRCPIRSCNAGVAAPSPPSALGSPRDSEISRRGRSLDVPPPP